MSGPNGTINRIVVHGTVSACVPGGARGNAHYFQSASSGGLAHAVVDPSEIITCCAEETSCWHAPPNAHSLGVELCDWQNHPDHRGNFWGDTPHQQMLGLGARLVVDWADRHRVPKLWLSVQDLLDGGHGITSHANVAQAFHLSDHVDPGVDFPTDQFMALVRGTAAAPAPEVLDPMASFICEFTDPAEAGNLYLVDPHPMPAKAPADPGGRYGTRTRITSPDVFYVLAGDGIPVRSARIPGAGLYALV